jgi:SAM-dependent methyltransferase
MGADVEAVTRQSMSRRVIGALHGKMVFSRRVEVLADQIAALLPANSSLLDIGAGSGDVAAAILARLPDLRYEGVDVLVRPNAVIPVTQFDGQHLPFDDSTFDFALLVDVLHHTDDPERVMAEAARVARRLIIKDHYRDGLFGSQRLRFMDWVGNAPHGVRLPYNYLGRRQWADIWHRLDLKPKILRKDFRLYRQPLEFFFGGSLHFIVELERRHAQA